MTLARWWAIKHEATGKAGQARADEQKIIDEKNRRIEELGFENESLEKAAAFNALNLA